MREVILSKQFGSNMAGSKLIVNDRLYEHLKAKKCLQEPPEDTSAANKPLSGFEKKVQAMKAKREKNKK